MTPRVEQVTPDPRVEQVTPDLLTPYLLLNDMDLYLITSHLIIELK